MIKCVIQLTVDNLNMTSYYRDKKYIKRFQTMSEEKGNVRVRGYNYLSRLQ